MLQEPEQLTGRTVLGARDDDGNGVYETVLLFNSKSATLSGTNGAGQTLVRFGATGPRANFDGAGSTGRVVNGNTSIATSRKVPHALAIYSLD
ncbi:MAG: hypothetical protein U0414_43415 [Polyangiaceae bacterium]